MIATGARSRRPFLLLGIVALGLFLRAIQLSFQPLWWDEGYSVFFATRDFATLLARTAVDIHPPLYYILLQIWIALAGKSDIALRLFSVAVGMASLPLVYIIARQLANRAVAIISLFLLAISPLHIYYSQEVRMYGLVTLLLLASSLLLFALLRVRPKDRPNGRDPRILWVAYVIVSAAALYTQYFATFLLAAQALAVVLWLRGRVSIRPWVVAWACVVALYLPWLAYAGPKLYSYVTAKVGIEQYPILDPVTFLAQHLAAFSVGHVSTTAALAAASLLFVGLAAFGVVSVARQRRSTKTAVPMSARPQVEPVVILFIVPLLLGWLVNLVYSFHPVHYERLLLFVAPFFYILVALGLHAVWRRSHAAGLLGLLILATVSVLSLWDFYTTPRYAEEDYRPLIADLQSLAAAGDTVLAPYPWQIGYLETYYRGPEMKPVEVPGDEWDRDRSTWDRRLASMRNPGARVWLIAYQTKGRRLEDQLANSFSSDYRLLDDWYGNTRLIYFGVAPDPPLVDRPVELSPGFQLLSYGSQDGSVTAGNGFIPVRLHLQSALEGYSYSLRLVDSKGEKRVQQDAPIPEGDDFERRGIVIPAALPAGEYQARLVIYRRSDGNPLPFPGGQTELVLADVNVTAAR